MDIRWGLGLAGYAAHLADLLLTWLMTYAVHSTALILGTWWLVTRSWARWSPGWQHAMWTASLLAGFVTAAVQLSAGFTPLGGALRVLERGSLVRTVRVLDLSPDTGPGVMAPPYVEGAPRDGVRQIERRAIIASDDGRWSPAVWMAVVWLGLAAALLVRLWLLARRPAIGLERRVDAAHSLAGGALRHLTAVAGIRRTVTLTTSERIVGPAAISTGEIVLPARVLSELTVLEQESLLAHELAHVVRRDTSWLWLGHVAGCLAWFQPLNRLALRQMQLAAEFAADEWAVGLTRQPIRLARVLLRVASWLAPGRPAHLRLSMGANGSPLVQRVRRLTAPEAEGPPSPSLGGRVAGLAFSVAMCAALAAMPRIDVGGSGAGPSGQPTHVKVMRFEANSPGSRHEVVTVEMVEH